MKLSSNNESEVNIFSKTEEIDCLQTCSVGNIEKSSCKEVK